MTTLAADDPAARAAIGPSAPNGSSQGPREEGDARRFGRNVGSAAIAQLVAQVLTLAAGILLARTLDVRAYGIFVFGFAFPSWFLLLISLGLDEVVATDVAADRSKAARYLTLVALVRLVMAAIALVALGIAVQLVLTDPFARTITIVLGASGVVATCAGTFTGFFRAFERLEYGALLTILERCVTVGAVAFLLVAGFGLYEVSLAFLGGSVFLLVLSVALSRRLLPWFSRDVDANAAGRLVARATPFALFNAVGTFTYTTGLVLLTLMRGPASAGLFNAAFTLLLAMFSFLSIVSLTTLPMISRIHADSRERLAGVLQRIQKLSIVGGVPLAFGGWLYADAIVTTFYGDNFLASADLFRVLVVCFAVETTAMGIGPALVATGHAKEKLYIASVGATLTIGLSVALIPPFGPLGAAYAFLASRVLFAVVGGIAIRRYVGPLMATGPLAKSLLAGSVMLLVLLAVPGLSLWTGVLLGGIVYLTALTVIRGTSREDRVVVWDAVRGALFR